MMSNNRVIHTTWLVQDTSKFAMDPRPTSSRDELLRLGLTYQEWVVIYFEVIGVSQEGYLRAVSQNPDNSRTILIGEFEQDDPALESHPMLSRICGILHDAIFEADEIEELHRECLSLSNKTDNPIALSGLNKLLQLCDRARQLQLSIYLMSD